MASLTLRAPAKINLALHILVRREDGYHELAMLMEKISLCDEIRLEKTTSAIELVDTTDIPPEKNLAFRAAKRLHEVSAASWGVRIQLAKKIPMGAGLGGGSSDAAAVLKGLNQIWELDWPVKKLSEIGVQLGADVPFFLSDGPALVRGIGERVIPQRQCPKLWIILIYPGVAIDTKWAYRAWDQNQLALSEARQGRVEVLTQGNQDVSLPRTFEELLEILHNDFEAVVFPKFPEIVAAKSALQQAGAPGTLMSGSGSSVFGLFETKEERERAVKKLTVSPRWQVTTAEN